MLPCFSQIARTGLPGPAFLDFLARFKGDEFSVLHSGHPGGGEGFSVIGRNALVQVRVEDERSRAVLHTSRHLTGLERTDVQRPADPLDALEHVLTADPQLLLPHHPLTTWIGYISYDIARRIEEIGNTAKNDLHTPLLEWRLFEQYYLYEHATQMWSVVVTLESDRARAEKVLSHMAEEVARSADSFTSRTPKSRILEQMPRGEFIARVRRIKEYIAAGDIFQANFAQRWRVETDAHPIDIFRRLMQQSPAPYAALLVNGDRAIISASPELFLHRIGRDVFTRPIKGTRPRDLQNAARDEQLRTELLHSEKDKAELAMIVDLLRNDLGRVAEYGSVKVVAPREIEMLPTLWHAVATLRASLATPNAQQWSPLLRAALPGGSITGAPKIRAMQIIEELEQTRRGLYCGAIGCIGTEPEHRTDKSIRLHPVGTLNIAIRTLQMHGNIATLHAGAGIVADSDPALEYEETLHKAAALLRALGV